MDFGGETVDFGGEMVDFGGNFYLYTETLFILNLFIKSFLLNFYTFLYNY